MSDTTTECDFEFDPSVVSVVRRRVSARPDAVAVGYVTDPDSDDGLTTWTYAELDARARAIAARLQSAHPAGSRVLLLYPVGPPFVAAFLGCLYAGMVAVPSPTVGTRPHQRERIRVIGADAQAAAVLTDGAGYAEVLGWAAESGLDRLDVLATDLLDGSGAQSWREAPTGPDSLVLLQYTSGSTGDPRGVMVTNANLLRNAALLMRLLGLRADDRAGGWIPLFHDMGLSTQLLPALLRGSSYLMMDPTTFVRSPYRWLRMLDRYDVAVSAAPNFAFDHCTRRVGDDELARLDLSRLRAVINGSEPIHAGVLTAFAKRFVTAGFRLEAMRPSYGMAEATVYVSGSGERSPVIFAADAARLEANELAPAVHGGPSRSVVGCGQTDNFDVRVVDPSSGAPRADGRVGEIWLRGPSVAAGYWNRPDATAATFEARTADGDGPFLRTGDLGALRDGELYVTGRIKEMLIVRGRNIYPHDVENVLRANHPDLGNMGAVFAVPPGEDDPAGADLVIVTHEVKTFDPAALTSLAYALKHTVFREFGIPVDRVMLLRPGGVLRTTSGKVQRGGMRAAYLNGELADLLAAR